MNKMKITFLAGLLMILAACGSGTPVVIPEVNDANCVEAVFENLEASVAREEITLEEFQDFYTSCSSRARPPEETIEPINILDLYR